MNVDLNNSPDLSMEEITKQLFNNEFMSDVQFRVEGRILYAHSWELMKRSTVFRAQFRENFGSNHLIPVEDISYKAVYEFLHFIYTDEMDTDQTVRCEMLKLAVTYKIAKLENILLNMACDLELVLQLFDFSVVYKYELIHNFLLDFIIQNFYLLVKLDSFYGIRSVVMEEILICNQIPPRMTEVTLFNEYVRWMNRYCAVHEIPLSERRTIFDKLLRLIRFPCMSTEELRQCLRNEPNLLTSDDITTISEPMVCGPRQIENQIWNSNHRLEYVNPVACMRPYTADNLATNLTVSHNLILCGLRYGAAAANYQICITSKQRTTGVKNVYSFWRVEFGTQAIMNFFSLNESIILKPDVDYTIDLENVKNSHIYCRKSDVGCIVNGPSDLVMFTSTGDNLFEIFFKLPTV